MMRHFTETCKFDDLTKYLTTQHEKNMKNIRKLIKEHLEQKPVPDEDDLGEESFVKTAVNDITEGNVESILYDDELNVFSFKSKTFPIDEKLSSKVYGGEIVTRESLGYDNDLDLDSDGNLNDNLNSSDEINSGSISRISTRENDTENSHSENDVPSASKKPKKGKFGENVDLEVSDPSDEDITSDDNTENEEETDDHSSILYSKAFREENSSNEQGAAIRNQLNLWEILLEARITLQKCLAASNQLPKFDKYEEFWSTLPPDDKSTVIECRDKVWELLEKLINLQNMMRKQCPEYSASRDVSVEDEASSNLDLAKIKRQRLLEYLKILEKQFNDYASYRNASIQKWNDKTKISCGKFAKSNFSAFDQPILKQIEQIIDDKHRLIQRTYTKRSQYNIIGETNSTHISSNTNLRLEVNLEIFDDDDFYHKLLRYYIEKKTADISDPTQMRKKWIKLQHLKNKMKRKIDARRTKGRKIKYDVHPKLVNFMAPIITNQRENRITNELCYSIFGKNLKNT